MIFVLFIVADATYDTVIDAFWFKADQVEYFTNMVSSLATVWILELFDCLFFRH